VERAHIMAANKTNGVANGEVNGTNGNTNGANGCECFGHLALTHV